MPEQRVRHIPITAVCGQNAALSSCFNKDLGADNRRGLCAKTDKKRSYILCRPEAVGDGFLHTASFQLSWLCNNNKAAIYGFNEFSHSSVHSPRWLSRRDRLAFIIEVHGTSDLAIIHETSDLTQKGTDRGTRTSDLNHRRYRQRYTDLRPHPYKISLREGTDRGTRTSDLTHTRYRQREGTDRGTRTSDLAIIHETSDLTQKGTDRGTRTSDLNHRRYRQRYTDLRPHPYKISLREGTDRGRPTRTSDLTHTRYREIHGPQTSLIEGTDRGTRTSDLTHTRYREIHGPQTSLIIHEISDHNHHS
ncbi:hypothetical protein J6590_033887 [Homalodisca vitripennis]|nr:hypothetical protein J6590_033887 [Homalodisca vitripennis]